MLLAYIFVAVGAGLGASVATFFLTSSFLLSVVAYVGVGSMGAILLPVVMVKRGANFEKFADEVDRETALPSIQHMAARSGAAVDTSMKILAVDDDPFILELIPILSKKAGFPSITVASSGEHALKLLAQGDTVFDCFLFDISMPEMDGIELCRQVRQLADYAKTPILMLTAMRDLDNMGQAYRAGATDYATKPFDIEELTMRLTLAQKAIIAEREAGLASATSQTDAGRISRSDLHAPISGLVDESALASYLTQLPKKEASAVQVYAVTFESSSANKSGAIQLLHDASKTVADCFETDRFLMAYMNASTLLVASTMASTAANEALEAKIGHSLRQKGYEVDVAIGGPVSPQGSKSERARLAIDGALARAYTRYHVKDDGDIAQSQARFGGLA